MKSLNSFFIFSLLCLSLFSKDIGDIKVDFLDVFNKHKIPRLIIDSENGKIEMVNKGAEDYYGYEKDDLIGMDIAEINTMNHYEVKKQWQAAVDKRKNSFQFKHTLASGEVRDVEVYSYPIRVENKDYLYSLVIDVTKREKALLSLKKTQKLIVLLSSSTMFFLVFSLFILYIYKEKYKKIADYDQLTGVYSRRCLKYIDKDKLLKSSHSSSLVMIDVNKFKKINDENGHLVGDSVLKNVSKIIKEILREEDLVIRYGGDEFLLVLKEVEELEALKIMERVSLRLRKTQNFNFSIEISYGVEEISEDKTLEEIIKRADYKMYTMKNGEESMEGLNCHWEY